MAEQKITKVGVSGLFVAKETLEVLLQSRNLVTPKGEILRRSPGGFCLPGGRLEDDELISYLNASKQDERRAIADKAFLREMGEESGRRIPLPDELPQPYLFEWEIEDGVPTLVKEAETIVPGLTKTFLYHPDLVINEFFGKSDYLYALEFPRDEVKALATEWQEGRGAILLPLQYTTGIQGIPSDHAMLLYTFTDYVRRGKLNKEKVL